jgi:hypothetical protein
VREGIQNFLLIVGSVMYLWNIHELKKVLMLDQLSEKYKFYYLFINMLFFAVFAEISLFFPTEVTIVDKVNSIIGIAVQSVGLIIAFKMNGGKEGKEFLARCTSLYVSLSIRFIIFTLGFLVLNMAFMGLLSFLIPNQYLGDISNIIDMAFIPIFEVVFFWRLAVHIRDVQKGYLKA